MALGRSPEKKVKDHSGAIYRGPLMLYTNYQGSSRYLHENFQDFSRKFNVKLCPLGRGQI